MTTPARTTTKGEATRSFLLGVAAEVFAERGYAGTTMAELFGRSGLTKGAFYFHFPSKQQLAVAVVERKQAEWLDRIGSELSAAGSPLVALRRLGPAMLALHREDPSAWSVWRLCRELAHEPDVAGTVRRDMQAWVTSIADVLRAAEAERGRPLPAAAEELAAVLVAAFDGLKELSPVLDGGGPARFEARVAALQSVVDAWLD
jgi:TetR/AcrR family transcriptional repressor of nem operon